MDYVIKANNVRKAYRNKEVLSGVDLAIPKGRIVGLIGPNGAGKTTLLKSLLGLAQADGDIQVLGMNPHTERTRLLESVSFIADTATLPRWAKVEDLVHYVAAVHPHFRRERAEQLLDGTKIQPTSRVKELSKGMITQLHLALVMAIDSKLLVLDEPTLGLDIIYRKTFYSNLLEDYFDGERTVLITTHQVEEIEHILTDLIFINDGKLVLELPIDRIADIYIEVHVNADQQAAAMAMRPIHTRSVLGGSAMIYQGVQRDALAHLGSLHTPGIADLFVATLSGAPVPSSHLQGGVRS